MRGSRDSVRFWTSFAVAALATWRATHLLSREDGPANVLSNLRARLGDGPLGELMDCFHCTSIWVAMPLTLFVSRGAGDFVPTWLALSGAACWMERFAPGHVRPVDEEQRGPFDGMLRSEAVGAPKPFAFEVEDPVR